MADDLYSKLMQTWPARAAQGLWEGLTLPGDVYQGNVSMYGPDGRINPEVINRSTDLAGAVTLGAGIAPAGANELRAGVRPYANVPDQLMGFRKNGPNKGYHEERYPHDQAVKVVFPDREIFVDSVRGMNANHAVERAYRNWPDAIHIDAID